MSDAPEQKPEAPSTPVPSVPPKTNLVWVAAIVGGLLGAVFSFALSRTFPAPPKTPPTPPPSEARQFADDVISKLKEGKNDEFKKFVRPAFTQMTEGQFQTFLEGVYKLRADTVKMYGASGEFEFARETTLSPTLARITFVERYAHGCLLWALVVYNSPEGWQVMAFSVDTSETGFTTLR